jgi:uncharacterized iron-regulated protein
MTFLRPFLCAAALLITVPLRAEDSSPAREFWLDLYSGEEVGDQGVIEDLAKADVIYIGEVHTIERHHRTQADLLRKLAEQGKSLALGMEQIEARHQPTVDRFNRGELDFDQLAEAIAWGKQWKNYEQYRPICETAQKLGIPVIALNAPAEVIRAVGRKGLAGISPEERDELPKDIVTDDPAYEKLMNLMLAVHMTMDPDKLRPIFEAQVARDETMAANIAKVLKGEGGQSRSVYVVCGRGHISYGLGTPDRVKRRSPQSQDRILLVTESGELQLSPSEEAMRREIAISHEDLRSLGRPLADYLRILPRQNATATETVPH